MGKSRDFGEICPLRGSNPGGGDREEGEVKKVREKGGDEIGNSGVTRACLFPI